MPFTSTFTTLALDELHDKAQALRDEGWRFVNIHAVHVEQGCDLYYVFEREGLFENFRIEGVTKEHDVPSITDLFFAAFVFENETRELFGVNMRDIALDFDGSFYALAESEPMTFISPEQKAAKDKARKAAALKAGRERKAAEAAAAAKEATAPVAGTDAKVIEEKTAGLDPEKAARVKAALEAKAKRAAAADAPAKEAPAPGEAEGPAAPAKESASPAEAETADAPAKEGE